MRIKMDLRESFRPITVVDLGELHGEEFWLQNERFTAELFGSGGAASCFDKCIIGDPTYR